MTRKRSAKYSRNTPSPMKPPLTLRACWMEIALHPVPPTSPKYAVIVNPSRPIVMTTTLGNSFFGKHCLSERWKRSRTLRELRAKSRQ